MVHIYDKSVLDVIDKGYLADAVAEVDALDAAHADRSVVTVHGVVQACTVGGIAATAAAMPW